MLASEIAAALNYEIIGSDLDVGRITWWNCAKEKDIAVARNKRELMDSMSQVVLTEPVIVHTDKTLLITHETIEYSMVRICKLLANNGDMIDYSLPTNYYETKQKYFIGKDCIIDKSAVIQPGVKIGDYVSIGPNCVIEPDVFIGSGTKLVSNIYIGSGSRIGTASFYHYYNNDLLGQFNGYGTVKIGAGTVIGSNTVIQRGTMADTIIGTNNMIGNCIDIGHDVQIGDNCKIVSQTGIASDAIIKNNVTIYGQVGVSNKVVIGNNVVVKGKTIVTKSVADDEVIYGPFGRRYSDEMKLMAKVRLFLNRKDV